MPVMDASGQSLGYRQLRKHPLYKDVWNTSYADELGCLCQGIGTGPGGKGQRISGTDTFFAIQYDDIPADRRLSQ